jgi:hypothetical protein
VFFAGDPKDMLNKALKMGVCFHEAPFWGTCRDVSFLGPLRKEINFFIGGIFMRNLRDV